MKKVNFEDNGVSQTVRFLRFQLIFLVLMIHANILEIPTNGNVFSYDYQNFTILNNIINLVSGLISLVAVPLFYFISGYMFFWGIESFDKTTYISKIKKRAKSLLVPYIFWNIAVLLIFLLAQSLLPSLMSGATKPILDYTIKDFLKSFWSLAETGEPIAYQLWFIRDLMVTVVLSPIIYKTIKSFGCLSLLILFAIWLSGIGATLKGLSPMSLAFFTFGGYCVINKIEITKILSKYRKSFFTAFSILISTLIILYNIKNGIYPSYAKLFKKLLILSELPIAFYLAFLCVSKYGISVNKKLTTSSFFLYCFHAMPLVLSMKVFLKILNTTSEIVLVLVYFMSPLLIVCLSTLVYIAMEKICPKFLALITGGR